MNYRGLEAIGPLALVRLGGVLAILAVIFSGSAPSTNTGPGGAIEMRGRYQLTPASMSRARMLTAVEAEAEARGCSVSIGSAESARDGIGLTIQCGVRGDLMIVVEHLPSEWKDSDGPNDCLRAAGGLICRSSGSVPEALRSQLLTAFGRVFTRVFPQDPFAIEQDWDASAFLVAAAIAILIIFLWLVVSGAFTFGSCGRREWIALVPFVVALVVREVLTLHSVQEIEIQFALTPVGRHSVVYPLFQLFFSPLVQDAQAATFHVNAVLGALAVLPLYLFVAQRTEDRAAAFVVACLFAVNPTVARFAPTDSPYSFILVTWFSGLALLSAPAADALSTFGGAALLGIAASGRMDGLLYLAASALVLDPKLLATRIREAPRAALAGAGTIVLLIGVQMYFLLAFHLAGPSPNPALWNRTHEVWQEAILRPKLGDLLWTLLLAVGVLAGFMRRWRLALGAFVGLVLLLLPIPRSGVSANSWHRLVPIAAFQCVVAGIGAVAFARWRRSDWAAALPGVAVTLYVLLAHRAALSESYVFNVEYAMVRAHLVHDGVVDARCDMFVMSRVDRDIDIRDFRRVVPGITTVDCGTGDCLSSLRADRCHYYVRSATCFFHPDGLSRRCAEARSDEEVRHECLVPECAALESAATLTLIEEHSINPRDTFPDEAWNYPERIPVALFKAVRARGDHLL